MPIGGVIVELVQFSRGFLPGWRPFFIFFWNIPAAFHFLRIFLRLLRSKLRIRTEDGWFSRRCSESIWIVVGWQSPGVWLGGTPLRRCFLVG